MIFEKVREIVVEQLGVEEDEVSMDSAFIDDLGADSLDIVELIMALEEEFDMEIPDEEAEKITTVGNVVEYIKAHQQMIQQEGDLYSRLFLVINMNICELKCRGDQ